jgi:peptide-methionine (R)-S-oxide reductase
VEPRAAARTLALGRIAAGLGLIVMPRVVTAAWLGQHGLGTGATVLARAMGARDLVIGAGLLAALERGAPTRGWLSAGVVADATDLTATIAECDSVPAAGMVSLAAAAGSGIALGAFALAGADS